MQGRCGTSKKSSASMNRQGNDCLVHHLRRTPTLAPLHRAAPPHRGRTQTTRAEAEAETVVVVAGNLARAEKRATHPQLRENQNSYLAWAILQNRIHYMAIDRGGRIAGTTSSRNQCDIPCATRVGPMAAAGEVSDLPAEDLEEAEKPF